MAEDTQHGALIDALGGYIETGPDRTVRYYDSEGKLHRANGPAVVYASGARSWYRHGIRHREDGPAIVHADGSRSWWVNGKHLREDGPAYETTYGLKEWFLSGSQYSEAEYLNILAQRRPNAN